MYNFALMENRIQAIRESNKLSLSEVARRANTTASQIQKLERGERRLTSEWMERLATALNCHPADFLHEGNSIRDKPLAGPSIAASPSFASIPVYNVSISSGHGAWNDNEVIIGRHSYNVDWLRKVGASPCEKLAIITNTGESNIPEIRHNDKLLIDTGKTKLIDGKWYAFQYDGSLLVKQAQLVPGGKRLILRSANPAYQNIETALDDITTIGQVLDLKRAMA